MSQALPGRHYCATHQGNHSHYDESNCELCRAQRERDEARAIANDRDAMVDHRDRALTAMYQCVDVITQERDEARAALRMIADGDLYNADARLIAAAPELYDALRELLTDMVIAQGNMRKAAKRDPAWEGCAEVIQPRVDAARAAIAKAESKP